MHSGDRCDGIVRHTISGCQYLHTCIAVGTPLFQNLAASRSERAPVRCLQPYHRHGPFYNAHLHIRKLRKHIVFFNRCFCHGKSIVAALKMLMAENRTAHNGQICIRANEIVGQNIQHIKQLLKHCRIDLHCCMLFVEHNAVLVVIPIG